MKNNCNTNGKYWTFYNTNTNKNKIFIMNESYTLQIIHFTIPMKIFTTQMEKKSNIATFSMPCGRYMKMNDFREV